MTKKKLRTRTPKELWVVVAILVLSSLPYFHEVITTQADGVKSWVPILGIENMLLDVNGKVLGFSTYRMFLYTLLIFVFAEIGWIAWMYVSRRKSYYYALFVPIIMGAYQIGIILLNLRKSPANDFDVKLYILWAIGTIMMMFYLRKNSFTPKIALKWIGIIGVCILPFFHDIITTRGADLMPWVPVIGLENLLTDYEGYVGGFGSYRAFVYFLLLHVYAHLGWMGSLVFYDHVRIKPRPFLVVPVIISLSSVVVILFGWRETTFNSPDIKFYLTITISLLLFWNFFFNDKVGHLRNTSVNQNL